MRFPICLAHTCLALVCLAATVTPALATEWFVAPGGTGPGTSAAPFGHIQDGLNAARAGDTVTVVAGTYAESLRSVRSGSMSGRIVVRAQKARTVIVTASGRVLSVSHGYLTIDGLVLDGQYGVDDTVQIASGGTGFTLRNSEVRKSSRDAIDMGAVNDVLIDKSSIHHALNAACGRTDAHGIVAGAVHRLTIRNTDIYAFSGDGVQVDPGRAAPGWSNVVIDGCRIWLTPLPTAENGFPAGTVTGENAVDTKASASYPRASLVIRKTQAWGFRGGLISNMAAFNLKENIDALLDGVLVHDSEIAFRLRRPGSTGNGAWVRIENAIVHDASYGFRYEDNIENLHIWNSTVGLGVPKAFRAASSSSAGLDVRNLLVLAATLPAEAAGVSNLAVGSSAFVNAAGHNYQLSTGSLAVDTGMSLSGVTHDFAGKLRPQGLAYDVGAYEKAVATSGSSSTIALGVMATVVAGGEQFMLTWTGAQLTGVDVCRNGVRIATTPNDGIYKNTVTVKGSYSYMVCEMGTSTCSNVSTVVY